ncbi:tail fiber protein [Yersinia enterocolitica]|nr:tail fiber protein [Yersinia enterocolitica]
MYGLDNNSGVSVMPAIAPTTSPTLLWFTEGGANQSPSYPGQDWFNQIQAELLNVLVDAAIAPNKADRTQLSTAIKKIIASSANVIPVGVPLPWPTATAPLGWLKCNGAAFDKAKYPMLATSYPTGNLPDLRGEFLRGWDDGRGVDSGRGLLTVENDEIRSHRHLKLNVDTSGVAYGLAAGNFSGQQTGGFYLNTTIGYDSGYAGIGTGATGGSETRPRNIAFNYIVRAA